MRKYLLTSVLLAGLLLSGSPPGMAEPPRSLPTPPTRAVQASHHFTQSKPLSTMSDQSAAQTVRTFLTAVQKGDQATLGALLHPSVRWSQPGANQFSGLKRSSTDVFRMVGNMFEATANTLRLTDVKQLAVNGNRVACLLHWNGVQPTGPVLDVDNIDVYTVEDGRIVDVMVFTADSAQEDQFWGN